MIDEIKEIDKLLDLHYWSPEDIDKAVDLLTDYKEMLEREYENEPLRWDEIEAMKGKPVWIEILDTNEYKMPDTKYWSVVVGVSKTWDGLRKFFDSNFFYHESEKGKSWQAYRKEHV